MSLDALKARLQDIHSLNQVGGLLGWDQRVKMPSAGAPARAEHLATISKLSHQLLTSDETANLIEAAKQEIDPNDFDSDDTSLVRVAAEDYRKAAKIPTALVVEMEKTVAIANEAWVEARAKDDFSLFQSHVEKIYDLVGQQAEALGYKENIYDALIDLYESDMTTAEVKRLFDELRTGLVPIVKAIGQQADKISDAPIHQPFDVAKQREFGEMVVSKLGFDFSRGRQDESVHPFCSNFSRNDVRLTTRFDPNWLSPALFGTIHEAGHGMYEQGSPEHLDHTILAGGTSLGVHESQSRMWENIVGRGLPFWNHFYGQLQSTFPEALGNVDLDTFYRAANKSEPSLIRVEADEVTYNLHIMVRFDIEVAVLNGDLAVKDLPEAWNAKYEEYLGIRPPNNRLGVLQDIHWSLGIMGYFPTYALGNLLSVQFYELALKDHPSIPDEMAEGKFDTLLNWMREHIHQHGRKYSSPELVKRVTGGAIQTGPFLGYIRQKFGQLYDL